jgi:YD repeat-containing protein
MRGGKILPAVKQFFCCFVLVIFVLPLSIVDPALSQSNLQMSYDALGRLTQVTYPGGIILQYSYDAAGNRTAYAVTGSPNTPPNTGGGGAATCTGTANLAAGKAATASTSWSAGYTPDLVVDGNGSTRWNSAANDNSGWLNIDLGSVQTVCKVKFNWVYYPNAFEIRVSQDAVTWTTVATVSSATPVINEFSFATINARHIRFVSVSALASASFSNSIYEIEVYAGTLAGGGGGGASPLPIGQARIPNRGVPAIKPPS